MLYFKEIDDEILMHGKSFKESGTWCLFLGPSLRRRFELSHYLAALIMMIRIPSSQRPLIQNCHMKIKLIPA